MTVSWRAKSILIFVVGLSVGAFWSPIKRPRSPSGRGPSYVRTENAKRIAETGKVFGEETADFLKQFESMSIRIKQYPVDVQASHDGRFDIHLLESGETIASDLFCPGRGGVVEKRVRHYSFSNDDENCSIDFVRSVKDSKTESIVFDVAVGKETRYLYLDKDGDGLWDRFTDLTHEPPKTYVRNSVEWKWNVPQE